ncbi:MAG: RNA methyltransferase [Candidatus Polarisedimenticolaceae bacterium]|nr:RNA methyltransferase [Candidatus Polarisedimenticolaceae bacterium]
MQLDEIKQRLRLLGAKPCHERYLLRNWLHVRPLGSGRGWHKYLPPKQLCAALPAIEMELKSLARLHSKDVGEGEGTRLLIKLEDEQIVESVLLPRRSLCVSTQIGCAVGCLFCMTGKEGLLRQLSSAEIVAQVVLARSLREVKNVVFMGMGEPAHNLDNVLEAIDLLGTLGGIGHKRLIISSVGDRQMFERLPQGPVKPALALSLHTTSAALRRKLLPQAPAIDPVELVGLSEGYARAIGYPIQYQWTLLQGVNDSEEELKNIVKLLKGKYAILNLIPYNKISGLGFNRPSWEHAEAMARYLNQRGIFTKLRDSVGQDIDGGCGQLRARVVEEME